MEFILLKTVEAFYFSSIVAQFSFIHGAEVNAFLSYPHHPRIYTVKVCSDYELKRQLFHNF